MRPRRSAARLFTTAICLVTMGIAVGCTSDSSTSDTPSDTPPDTAATSMALSTGEPMTFNVLVYNIEYGGNASTDKVIRSLDADVVGVLESYNRLPEIAKRTGYPYYNVGLQLLSKYPILEPSGGDGLYAFIEVQPGYAVAFFNTHLDYVAFGPKLLAKGIPVADVLASENEVRTSSLQIQLPQLGVLAASGYPVLLTGDFNEPSSLDYTAETVGAHEGVTDPVPWPVSEALFDIGFTDTFRETHPDPVANPGVTWGKAVSGKGSEGDRIDYVYAGGPVTTTDSRLVGKTGTANVEVAFDTWTSDHRAVLSEVDLTPVELPTNVSLDRRMLTAGEDFTVYYKAPGSASSIAVLPAGGDPSAAVESHSVNDSSGTLELSTADLAPAGYDIALLDTSGKEIARNQFWVRARDAQVTIDTDRKRYAVGDPIQVTWDNGPANRWDWIGVYRASAADPNKDNYLLWGYTGGHDSGALPPSVSGSMALDDSAQGKPWPLPPGKYVVHYLLTDQYESAGKTALTVIKS